jgi:Protein of unknown function (DUF1186)/SEC-C motif
MEIRELFAQLDRHEGSFPDHLVSAAIARRDEMLPVLLETLEEVAVNPEPWLADQERMGHIYALYLLALFRETRAYPLVVRIFSRPGEFAFDLAGDTVTEDLGRILASVSGGDVRGMAELIENEQANEYVRSAAMSAAVSLVRTGQRTRDEIMAYVLRLFRKLERKPGVQWDGLATACADLWPQEAIGELERAFEEDLIDSFSIDWEDIQDALHVGKERALCAYQYCPPVITDLAKDMGWMQRFQEVGPHYEDEDWPTDDEGEEDAVMEDSACELPSSKSEDWWPEPFRRGNPKIGRNEPCPCGSGKKFKKCCGRGESAMSAGAPK